MDDVEILEWIQKWYADQCDGLREHQYGVEISTLDNPGWAVQIDLQMTPYAAMNEREERNADYDSANNWWVCRIKDQRFEGYGGPKQLSEILRVFREWVEA